MSGIQIKLKPQNVFETSLFMSVVKEYFQNMFPKIFERYSTTPAKGGTGFEKYSDMSYPMHVLNGILPAMMYLEQKLLENEYISKLVRKEDSDIKMLIECTLLGITLHDINKLVGKSDLKESLEHFDEILHEIGLELPEEEKNIIKYLIVGTEDRTRYTIPDIKLPKRRNLDRIVKDYLLEAIHMADSISLPPEESFSHTFRLLQKKLQSYFPEVHTFYFHDSPYEVLSRYLLTKLISRVEGKILLISPKGFIWIGKPLNIDDLENILDDLETEYQNLLLDKLDSFLICNWQKAQLDIFRYITPTKDFVKEKLIPVLLEKKDLTLYHGLPSNKKERESIRREIEKLNVDGKLEIMVLLKFILTLTPNNNNVKKLKKEKEMKYFNIEFESDLEDALNKEDKEKIVNIFRNKGIELSKNIKIEKTEKRKNLWKIFENGENYYYVILKKNDKLLGNVDSTSPVLRNIGKVIIATYTFSKNKNALYDDLVELLTENYKDETIDIKEILKTSLSYASLDGNPIFGIKIQDVGDKQNICSICGAETSIVAKEGVAFGFAPRGFTNRAVVSIKSVERKICKTCLAEVMLRKLIFSRSKDLYAVIY